MTSLATAATTSVDTDRPEKNNNKGPNNTTTVRSNDSTANATKNEVSHYVVTAHPPGSVLVTCKCNFISASSVDVLIAKPRRIEIRQLLVPKHQHQPSSLSSGNNDQQQQQLATGGDVFPIVLQLNNIHGNLIAMAPLKLMSTRYFPTTPVFIMQERFRYAVIQYDATATPYPIITHASGSVAGGGGSENTGITSSSNSIAHLVGRVAETGPIITVDPECRCIVMHLYDGLITVVPINKSYIPPTTTGKNDGTSSRGYLSNTSMLGDPFHWRIEERTILALSFIQTTTTGNSRSNVASIPSSTRPISPVITMPLVCVLHQDSRGTQHITTHVINITKKQLHLYQSTSAPAQTPWLKKSAVDGVSSLLISVPPPLPSSDTALLTTPSSISSGVGALPPNQTVGLSSVVNGGILILGQRQFTYCSPGVNGASITKIVPVPQALYLSYDRLPDDPITGSPRYLIGDEFGNLHILSVLFVRPTTAGGYPRVSALQLETLGSCTISSSLCYLDQGLCFVGSAMGDSQLIQIHDEPINLIAPTSSNRIANDVTTADGTSMSLDDNYETSTAHGGDVPEDVMLDLADTTHISIVDEYTNLGPILDFDLVSTAPSPIRGNTTMDARSTDASLDNYPSAVSTSDFTAPSSAVSTGVTVGDNPQSQYQQSQVITASGTSKTGTIRVIRNGIGMNEYAAVEFAGIQAMWSIRRSFYDHYDTYLVQSFVGETRVLGVTMRSTVDMIDTEEESALMADVNDPDEAIAGTLEEIILPGLEPSASSLYVGNVQIGDSLLQITESVVLLISGGNDNDGKNGIILDTWLGNITVASANEFGQIIVTVAGGQIVYLIVNSEMKIVKVGERQLDREVSCINLNPFSSPSNNRSDEMDLDNTGSAGSDAKKESVALRSKFVAIGLWDDFSVRLLTLDEQLEEVACLNLTNGEDDENDDVEQVAAADAVSSARSNRNNMMARSLCLITLENTNALSSSSAVALASSGGLTHNQHVAKSYTGVNMLFVGLGDGTLISCSIVESMGTVEVQSKKEVCLGTQCVNLVPLKHSSFNHEHGSNLHPKGACVLATGDRPTVIYLAGVGGTVYSQTNSGSSYNPKLCYSNVNVASSENDDDGQSGSPVTQQNITVNVAAPFFSPLLFGGNDGGNGSHQLYTLCIADDTRLRVGVIDDIRKLHVATVYLGMAPRRIVHCPHGRLFAVGCIESGTKQFGFDRNLGDDANMGNCIRFIDDTTFEDVKRVDLEPFEMILSMLYTTMKVSVPSVVNGGNGDNTGSVPAKNSFRSFLLVGTAYALPDEDEPTKGRILVFSCEQGEEATRGTRATNGRLVRLLSQRFVEGGVYSMSQFFDGLILATVNSRTHICRLVDEDISGGSLKLQYVGNGHFGHILSLFVKSRARTQALSIESNSELLPSQASDTIQEGDSAEPKEEMIAIVGDLIRSISLVQYYPQHQTLEEIARDFNVNWTTAIEMLTDSVYLGAENWNNLFCLRRNTQSPNEEVRCRLDTIGEFHLGEMCNKFMSGSLVMPVSTQANVAINSSSRRGRHSSPSKKGDKQGNRVSLARIHRPAVVTGSQTLFATASGTIGIVLGMDSPTAAFFSALERVMGNPNIIPPIGGFLHAQYRACHAERRTHPAHGFVDGDLVESFLDLDRGTMEVVVAEMNRTGGWDGTKGRKRKEKDGNEINSVDEGDRPELTVDDVITMVEEIALLH